MTTIIPPRRDSAEIEAAVARWYGVTRPRLDPAVRVRVDDEQVRRALRELLGGAA